MRALPLVGAAVLVVVACTSPPPEKDKPDLSEQEAYEDQSPRTRG
ncbi:hypothetical protein CLV63_11475 [Murinocardiopsis flavida]|uniref:Lipoprotein n=1 Tax=Murinocardiopsis flavida TaxID=645275 RepID=A0A2P8DEK2_9ACTN|nr:hypothetical protein [Murinocardiopsis flavida]PSK95642.1 hypothetical protein CLV63_11475 [Murinocardiopsis flavida]